MSRKKGLSFEDKRAKMLEIFYEKKDVFQLKELEKIGPKEKGIVSQSVKEVVQSLVDDNLIESDKIGTSIYFWSFPSKAYQSRKEKLERLQRDIETNEAKLVELNKKLAKAAEGREETEERATRLAVLQELNGQIESVSEELEAYKDCDPDVLKELKEKVEVARNSANRWTDNIFQMKSWCKSKVPGFDESCFNKQFEIPEDLDYVE